MLALERTATQDEVKKAYFKMALKLHPDKNPGDEEAKERFQQLQKVYSVLGDPERRKMYDETGATEDEALQTANCEDMYEYFRSMYKKVIIRGRKCCEILSLNLLRYAYLAKQGIISKEIQALSCTIST